MTSSAPLISYIVPACNAAATLAATLESIAAQEDVGDIGRDVQVIVVDDGSRDRTPKIAAKFEGVTVMSRTNGGLAAARNTGLRRARGEHVCFLDADDTIEPHHGRLLLDALAEGADAAFSGWSMRGPNLESIDWTVAPSVEELAIENLLEFNPLAVGAVMLNRARICDLLGDSRWFDRSLRACEDWDLWLRLAARGATWASPVPQPLFNYRLRPGSLSAKLRLMAESGTQVLSKALDARDADSPSAAHAHWSIRMLGRAIVHENRSYADELSANLGPLLLGEPELRILAGSIDFEFRQSQQVGPPQVPKCAPPWRQQVEDYCSAILWRDPLLRLLDARWIDIDEAARRFARFLLPGKLPVVFGLGRNGQQFVRALDKVLPQTEYIACIDDRQTADVPDVARLQRISRHDLTSAHVVAVTPVECEPIMRSLAAGPASAHTLADLAHATASDARSAA